MHYTSTALTANHSTTDILCICLEIIRNSGLMAMLSDLLSPRHGESSGCGQRSPTHMEGSCEYIE
jgi:hypothetical protein